MLGTVINPGIVRQLEEFGASAVGLPGKRVLIAKKLPPQTEGKAVAVDLGFTGEVVEVRLDAITEALAQDAIPVISPLAQDAEGVTLNVNADTAAGTIAAGLQAAKMIYLSDVPGIMRDPTDKESLIPSVNRQMIEHLIEEEIIAGGMIPKVDSALHALEGGVKKCTSSMAAPSTPSCWKSSPAPASAPKSSRKLRGGAPVLMFRFLSLLAAAALVGAGALQAAEPFLEKTTFSRSAMAATRSSTSPASWSPRTAP